MAVIELSALSKTYRGKKGSRVHALNDLSLTVEAGEVFGFLGPNGAGKSTTIKTLMGLISPTSGSASLCGRPVTDAAARAGVGYLPENPAFYDFLSAWEYLSFVGETFGMGKGDIEKLSGEVLRRMDLSDAARRPIRTYSKGMVQRLGLAQAMIHDPDVYILDEPMSGLDPLGRALVKDLIRDLKEQGKTVFFSTHITADVETVCDRVGIIVGGRLQLVEMVEDVLESGIEGYFVQVRNCPPSVYAGMDVRNKSADITEVYVSREEFTSFMEKLSTGKGDVYLVEPKRKDLEAFFLEIVAKGAQ